MLISKDSNGKYQLNTNQSNGTRTAPQTFKTGPVAGNPLNDDQRAALNAANLAQQRGYNRTVKEIQHQNALIQERADELDKWNVPSESRLAEMRSKELTDDEVTARVTARNRYIAAKQALEDAQEKVRQLTRERNTQRKATGNIPEKDFTGINLKALQDELDAAKRDMYSLGLREEMDPTLGQRLSAFGKAVAGEVASGYVGSVATMQGLNTAYEQVRGDRPLHIDEERGDYRSQQQRVMESYSLQKQLEGNYDAAALYAAQNAERAKQGLSPIGQFAVETGIAGGAMLSDALVAALTGGTSRMAPMMFRVFGSRAQQARQEGRDVKQQVALGLAAAGVEWATEHFFGGNPVYDEGGKVVRDAAGNVVMQNAGWINQGLYRLLDGVLDSGTAATIMSVLGAPAAEFFNEGWEEVASDFLNPILERLITGEDVESPTIQEYAKSWIGGVALAGLGYATLPAKAAARNAQLARVGNSVTNAGLQAELLDRALRLNQNTEAFKLAQQIAANGNKTTAKELGELYYAFVDAGGARDIVSAATAAQAGTTTQAESVSTPTGTERATARAEGKYTVDNYAKAYMQTAGVSAKAAEARAKLVDRILSGKKITVKDAANTKGLNLRNPSYRAAFSEITGVEFPESVRQMSDEQLYEMALTAREIALQNQATADIEVAKAEANAAAEDEAAAVAAETARDTIPTVNVGTGGQMDFQSFAAYVRENAPMGAQMTDGEIARSFAKLAYRQGAIDEATYNSMMEGLNNGGGILHDARLAGLSDRSAGEQAVGVDGTAGAAEGESARGETAVAGTRAAFEREADRVAEEQRREAVNTAIAVNRANVGTHKVEQGNGREALNVVDAEDEEKIYNVTPGLRELVAHARANGYEVLLVTDLIETNTKHNGEYVRADGCNVGKRIIAQVNSEYRLATSIFNHEYHHARYKNDPTYRAAVDAYVDLIRDSETDALIRDNYNTENGPYYPQFGAFAGTETRYYDEVVGDLAGDMNRCGLPQETFDAMRDLYRESAADVSGELVEDAPDAPESYSIRSLFNAAGLSVEPATATNNWRYVAKDKDGNVVTHVTAEHVANTGIGMLIQTSLDNGSITKEDAVKQREAFADLINLILRTQSPDLVWSYASASLFSAVKSNSDGQYGTTVDFSTVCRKTQEMITAMSESMIRLGRGLTKEEVTELQKDIIDEGGTVNCPVCYVFSRWAGIGGILDGMKKFQLKYGHEWDDAAKLQARIDELTKATKKKADLRALLREQDGEYLEYAAQKEELTQTKKDYREQLKELKKGGKKRVAENAAAIAELQRAITVIDAKLTNINRALKDIEDSGTPELAWLKRVRQQPNYWEDGYVDQDSVLFNLEDADTFANTKPLAWGYRTSRGPAAGKAILPYSEFKLGDLINGPKGETKFDGTTNKLDGTQKNKVATARLKMLAQNLIGGQRFQSTSDFRYDYGLDYLMAFLELQAIGGKMQTYTKIIEFVDLVAAIGGDVNMSAMPLNAGYVTENGIDKLIYSNVTGINIEAAIRANRMYDNAQIILVGINDRHILAALEDSEETGGIHIGFVIPYHASGASINKFIRALVSNLGEDFDVRFYKDYSRLQNDFERENATKEQKRRADLRERILRGTVSEETEELDSNGKPKKKTHDWAPTEEELSFLRGKSKDISGYTFEQLRDIERRALAGDKDAIAEYESWSAGVLWDVYQKMWVDESRKDTYGVRLDSKQAEHIMPHEYWNKSVNRDKAYVNGFIFRSYCYSLGLTPRFTGLTKDGALDYGDFSDSTGYWKTLIDRPMYRNNGTYREQTPVNITTLGESISESTRSDAVKNPLTPEYAEERWQGFKVSEPSKAIAQRAADRFVERHKDDFSYSLAPVPAVEPTEGWTRGATFDEVKAAHPTLFELAADEADTRNPTQISGTVKTYRKIYAALRDEGFQGTILDASSGLGVGTEAGRKEYGFDVEDIEPFPDASYKPKYTDYSTLNKQYDAIISNAVLNVIPQDLRDSMIVKIGELLAPGGRAFINVRGSDVKNARSKVAINEDQMEYFISSTGSYQKGFTQDELVSYLHDALGSGFTVTPTKAFGGVSAVVTKDEDTANYSISPETQAYLDDLIAKYGHEMPKEMYKDVSQMARAQARAVERANKRAESEKAKAEVAKQKTKDANLAWEIYHGKTMREQDRSGKEKLAAEKQKTKDANTAWEIYNKKMLRTKDREYRAKLDEARREKTAAVREAIAQTKEVERAVADVRVDATKMAERKNAAKRLRVKEDSYKAANETRREKEKLRRNAARATLRSAKKTEELRAKIEQEQGLVDTIRKNPKERTFIEKVQESADVMRTIFRPAYQALMNTTLHIDQFAKRQKGGVLASTLVNIVGGASTTMESVFKTGLVDRAGNRIGDSMKDVFLCWDENGRKVDENKQALLQDYMLHRHNVDRMSFVSRALAALEAFEAENPWLAEMDKTELARLVAQTENETEKRGNKEARNKAIRYAALLADYTEARDKPVFPDSNGNPVTAETSRDLVTRYEAEHEWLKDKAQGIYDWWDLFMRTWVVGDTISAERYATMKEMYPNYVPTYRADKKSLGAANFVGMNGASVGSVVKKAKGGLSEIVNIEDSFANLAAKAIKVARTNELYKNIVDTAMLDEEGLFADYAYFDWDSVNLGTSYYTADGTEVRVDDSKERNTLLSDAIERAAAAGLTQTKDGDFRLSAWYDGQLLSAFISKDLYKSIGDTTGSTVNDLERTLMKVGNTLTGPMKTAITGINPNFALRNVERDLPTAIINSISGMAFPKYWARALAEIAKNSEHWQQFQALGGTHAGYYNNNQGFAKQMMKKKGPLAWTVEKLGTFNELTEAQTRFAEYLATIDRLGDTYENRLLGIKNAAEVTVDFSRHGRYGRVINAFVPYWNPAMQGIDKVVRSVIETKDGRTLWQQATTTLGRAAVTTILAEAILYAVQTALGRRDEWEELSDRTKDTYYCIPLPGDEHRFLKIPKNREWGAILGTPFSRLLEAANGRADPFENYIETSLEPNFLPGAILRPKDGKIESDIIGVSQALDLAYNKDFAGRTIVPYAYREGSLTEQYDADTSYFGRALGKLLNFSPMQIDYLVEDYFGDFGKLFTTAASEATWSGDTTIQDYGQSVLDLLKNPWLADTRYSNQGVSDYYEMIDDLGKRIQDQKNRMGEEYKNTVEYKTKSALNDLYGKDISALNREIREMPDGEEKDAAKDKIAQLARNALDFYEKSMSGEIANPELTAAYAKFPTELSDELIRVNGLSEDYAFAPTQYTPTKYTDPRKSGYEYVLDDEQKRKYRELYDELYQEIMLDTIRKSRYVNGSDNKKAEMLEAARDTVTSETREQFLDWLRQNYRSTKKSK